MAKWQKKRQENQMYIPYTNFVNFGHWMARSSPWAALLKMVDEVQEVWESCADCSDLPK
jgi:hypothetical protein